MTNGLAGFVAGRVMKNFLCLAAFVLLLFAALGYGPSNKLASSYAAADPSPQRQDSNPKNKELHWYKGNTHTHTINSDGDSTPEDVVRWYKEHRYNFLVLSDHNFLTEIDGLNAVHKADGKFILIRGEEITDEFADFPIHVNGLGLNEYVAPQGGTSVLDTVQRDVNAVRTAKGVPHINHPNFGWAINADVLRAVQNNRLFEIFNGHSKVNNFGGGGSPGLEEMWDQILSAGKLLYGIAVDDAHHFKVFSPKHDNPGRGWIVVRAPELSSTEILKAMEKGDFYASTGVELENLGYAGDEIRIKIKAQQPFKYTTYFIGEKGRLLKTDYQNPATYRMRGQELYVRSKVVSSTGEVAWTQPVTGKLKLFR
jgi:hypothetical protein